MEKLNLFFARIRELTFWQRLFSWRSLRNLSYEAFEESRSLQKELQKSKDDFALLEKEWTQANAQNENTKRTLVQMEFATTKKDEKISELKSKQILTKELQDKHASINAESGIRDVVIPLNFDEVKNLK